MNKFINHRKPLSDAVLRCCRSVASVSLLAVLFVTNMPAASADVAGSAAPTAAADKPAVVQSPQAAKGVDQRDRSLVAGKITSVTVLPDGAWVTRQVSMNMPASGRQTVQVIDLPRGIDQDSIQLHSPGLTLSAPMQWRDLPVEETEAYRKLDQERENLNKQLTKSNDDLLAAQTRMSIFKAQMAQAPSDKKHGSAIGAFLSETKARNQFDHLLNGILAERRQAQDALDRLMSQLQAIDRAQAQLRQKGPSLSLVLPLMVEGSQNPATTRMVTIRYRVRDAHWRPVYRADLDTSARPSGKSATPATSTVAEETPKVSSTIDWSLVAEVRQSTGEDWSGVPITLSMLDTRRYYPVPTLKRWTIGFVPTSKPVPMVGAALLRRDAEMASKAATFVPVDETGFNAEFRSAGPVTVASGSTATVIPLLHGNYPADAMDLITPGVSPLAILTARFTLDNATPLPAGDWQLFLNGAQIGRVHQAALSPKKSLSLGFGVDRRIVVSLDSPADQRDENGLIGKAQQLVRRRVVTVQSQHAQPVPVTVLMNLPVSEDADLAVDPLADNTPPGNKQYDGQDGVWAWSNQIKPGQKITINFGFRLRWPADKHLFGF